MVLKQANPLAIHQFHVEVDLLSMLHCPFVPELIDVYETESGFVLIETWIDGMPLNIYKEKQRFHFKRQRKQLILKAYSLLEEVHALNYVYVDLKPQNLLLKEGQLYLIDFNSCIEKDAQCLISASSFNFKKKENQKDFGLDAQALYALIRYMYPKNLFYRFLKQSSYSKLKGLFLAFYYLQRCFIFFLVICLSLSCIKQVDQIQKDALETYLKSKKNEDFLIAYQMTKKENMDLYLWIEKGWLDDALFQDFKISKKLIIDANKTHDPNICAYILKRIPKKHLKDLKEYAFQSYEILDQRPSRAWLEDYVSYLYEKNLFSQQEELIRYLLKEEIALSQDAFYKMGELYTKNMEEMNDKIACQYLEYALFLKTKNVSDLSIPNPLMEAYQNQEEWKSLFMIWEVVR